MDREEQRPGSKRGSELELFREPEPGEESDFESELDEFDEPVSLRAPVTAAVSAGAPAGSVEEPRPGEARLRIPRVVAVSGAKGGVGKTMLAANLGLYLATVGRSVMLVDADPGGANLHTCLGTRPAPPLRRVRRPVRSEADEESKALLQKALVATPFTGVSLLSAVSDEPAARTGCVISQSELVSRLRSVDADYLVVDLGAGLTRDLMDAYLGADLSIYLTVPEPTAIENTYAFVRGAFLRFLLSRAADREARAEIVKRVKSPASAVAPLDLLVALENERHPLAETVRQAVGAFELRIAINQTRLRADLELGNAMRSASRRRLGVTLNYLGHIDSDDTVWSCVRNRRPLLLESPGAKSSKKIEKIARRLLALETGKGLPAQPRSVPADTHHDLLEIERGATDDEIRRAYKRCREIYSSNSLCCYGLFEPHELERLRVKLDEAFDVLVDPARRRPYELSVFPPEPSADAAESAEEAEEEAPLPPDITPDTHFTGALLRQIRQSQRMRLHEVSNRTKIRIAYLKAIEEDDFASLPAPVYTGGFVSEFAKVLKLDSKQVSQTYVRRYREYLEERERREAG